jgi:membrane-associated phospholipid phosphatase
METIEALQKFFGEQSQLFSLTITYLGSESAYILLLSLYYWLIDPSAGRRLGIMLSLSFCSNELLKDLFAIPRPYAVNPEVATDAAQASAEDYSFPSGHAQGAATFWGGLALHYQRGWLWVLAIAMMVLVALSRVVLGVHYPIDVVAGLVIGFSFAWLSIRVPPMPWLVSTLWRRAAIVVCCGALAIAIPDIAKPLGVLAGFGVFQPEFNPPKRWGQRAFMGIFGLAASFAVLFALRALFTWLSTPEWADFWRYGLLTAFIVAGWPQLLRRFW